MKKLLSIAAASMLTLSAACCNFGIRPVSTDFSVKLCGDYFLHRNSAHEIFVSPMTWNGQTPIIPPKVVEVAHDERFIAAKQNHLERRSPNNPKDTYLRPSEGVYNYWILDTNIPKAYGPLRKSEFDDKRKELDVSESVVLREIRSYKPSTE